MTTLHNVTEAQTRRALGGDAEKFDYLKNPSPDHLHDPFYYKDMRELVFHLNKFKKLQQSKPNLILVVDGDYDTDGIMSSAILTASLSVFGITHRVYVPSMAEGYGLSVDAVNTMKHMYEVDGYEIGMILTADNGIQAFKGVQHATNLGIKVLITDHHIGGENVPDALAIVNPNQVGDLYPFKGNSGACVAWKTMLAYASTFQVESVDLIQDLIVFAGIANVADVMPILNENRYIVKSAVTRVQKLMSYKTTSNTADYSKVMNTPYDGYNTVFYGLFDLIMILQETKDEERAARGKSSYPLEITDELFRWYLSPLLNAPRRVHDTCLEGLVPFLMPDTQIRHFAIRTLINLNKKKSLLRDTVADAMSSNNEMVMCVNTRGGISGLIAGMVAKKTSLPSIVFSYYNPEDSTIIYDTPPCDGTIAASARSNHAYPLDVIMRHVNKRHPNLVGGGGHAAAAGFHIQASDYELFKQAVGEVLPDVEAEVATYTTQVVLPENSVTIDLLTPNQIHAIYPILLNGDITYEQVSLDTSTFAHGVKQTIDFQESLRPFGQDFNGCTTFKLRFDNKVFDCGWNPAFYTTFKFEIHGVTVLTFDQQWADEVKERLNNNQAVEAIVKLQLNKFRGYVTPQFLLSPPY